ncbi:MAG TPA: lipid-binding SYLF domain-containing protein [Stellaceae bacterium]|nr:lipid-binding SYLF domain-containing protein [Stellaceae bacterium]
MMKIASGVVVVLVLMLAPAARAASDQSNLVEEARITVDNLKKDQEFGSALSLMRRARAVLIVPALLKGGFFVGGEGGNGVLLTRNDGGWSYPAFYTLASASFGLQIGLEQAELVMIVMNEKALSAVMKSQFKVGADAGLAIVTLGSSAEAATTRAAGADIVVWASASGAYAGVSVNGSIIKPRASWNHAYYGHAVHVSDIVLKGAAQNPNADALRENLASLR